ncbi:MAG: DUF5652 family protein [Candidatus Peribacteria bacterium]|jgi:hypothetical protein|nr:DUF5652 family protein [Candidatus Peribacteria bacterium]
MEEMINVFAEDIYPTAREVFNEEFYPVAREMLNVDAFNPDSFPSREQMGARIFTGNFARMGRLVRAFVAFVLRELVRKAIAMRKAGRNNQKIWFVCLLLINSVGILPILYILFFQKKRKS